MDREISNSFRQGQLRRRVGAGLGSLAFLLAIGLLLPGWLRPTLQVLLGSEVEAKKARIELTQLEAEAKSEQVSSAARLDGLHLDLATLRRDQAAEARRQLELATTRSTAAGVLTWVVPQEGATVHKGEVIARIADVASFRVAAKVSDVHSAKLGEGAAVRVRIDGQMLDGRLTQVYPTIENGSRLSTTSRAMRACAATFRSTFWW